MARAADNSRQSICARTISVYFVEESSRSRLPNETCAYVMQIQGKKFTKSVTNRTDGYTLCALFTSSMF
jgi:hypothetical protein